MKQRVLGFVLAGLPFLFILIFVGFPVVQSVMYTLGFTGGPNQVVSEMAQNQVVAKHGPTLGVYRQLWHSTSFRSDFWSTIWVTLVSVVLLLIVSWAIALYLRLSNGRLSRVVSAIYIVPMFIPGVIAGYALLTFWEQGGYVNTIANHLGDPNFPSFGHTLMGVVVGQVWTGLPFSVLMLASGLSNIPDSVMEAARDVGARLWTVCWRILLPLNILPTAIVVTFSVIGSLGAYTIPFLIGPTAPQMLGVAMTTYYGAFNEPQQAEAMAVMIFIAAAFVGSLYVWANLRLDKKAGASR
jgi:ABC-type spermidine/putrescine transport system permease subunit I